MNRFLGKMMISIVLLCVAGYVGYQVWLSSGDEYETRPAIEYVVNETVSAKGIAIREEILLEGYAHDDISYLLTDGTHVSYNMAVAQRVTDPQQVTNRMKRDMLEEELENLEALNAAAEVSVLQTESLPQHIYENIDRIAVGAASGELASAQDLYPDVITQLNRRSLIADPDTDFSARIEELQLRIEALGDEEEVENAVVAPEPGYFAKTVDGLETVLTPETMEELTVDEFVSYINAPASVGDDSLGRLVTSHIWYFAAVVSASEADNFREGRKVELDFGLVGQAPFIARVHRVIDEISGARAIVVFECDVMSEALIGLRAHNVTINLSEMSGYKFPLECIRYIGTQPGVYVLETTYIQFKPVEIIYEDEQEGYVVLSQNYKILWGKENNEKLLGLDAYDQVIIGGNGLEDGKVLKQ